MGTAVAMHAARRGHVTSLWANRFDLHAYAELSADRKHPLLGEHLPDGVRLFGPNELEDAAAGAEIVVLGANSHGARSLAGMVRDHVGATTALISVAKGLEPGTGARMSQVYGEELPGPAVVAVGGPCLAAELAGGLPTAGVWASADEDAARAAGAAFDDRRYQLTYPADVVG